MSVPEPLRQLEDVFAEASRQDFASDADERAWLAEHGVRFERCSAASCDRCKILFSVDYEPGVRYGQPLRATCLNCGGPTVSGG